MTSVVLIDRLCAEFDVELDTNILDTCPTIRDLAQHVRSLVGDRPETARGPGLWCEYQAPEDGQPHNGTGHGTVITEASHDCTDTSSGPSNGHAMHAPTAIPNGMGSNGKKPPQSKGDDGTRSHEAQAGRAARKAARRAKYEGGNGTRSLESAATPGSSLNLAKCGDTAGLQRLHTQGGVDLNAVVDRHGLTPLQWAAGGGHLTTVRYLVDEAHCPVDKSNKEGRTPLMWACRNGHLDVATFLVERGANVHAVTRKGVSALHWATWGGSVDVARWLLSLGLDLEALSNAGCNSAVWAAAAGRVAMCQFLLDQGADFNKVNHWGHGVVSKASWHGHTTMLKWLFEHTNVIEQLFIINHVGEIPVELAEQAGHTETRDFMLATMRDNPRVRLCGE